MTDQWEQLRKALEDDIEGFEEREDLAKNEGLRNVAEAYRLHIKALRGVLAKMAELEDA